MDNNLAPVISTYLLQHHSTTTKVMTNSPNTPRHFQNNSGQAAVKQVNPYPLGHPLRYLYDDCPEDKPPQYPSPEKHVSSIEVPVHQSPNDRYQHERPTDHSRGPTSHQPRVLHGVPHSHHVPDSPAPQDRRETNTPNKCPHKNCVLIIHCEPGDTPCKGPRAQVLELSPEQAAILLRACDLGTTR